MKNIDIPTLRSFFDELQISTRVDDDGDLIIVQEADEDFAHDVLVFITALDGRLCYTGAAHNYAPEGDLLFLANRHNRKKNIPTAVVTDGEVRMTYTFFLDEDVSEEYVKKNCIILPLSAIWSAFVGFDAE